MNKFKVGDIVECTRDNPYGAGIKKGELAQITKLRGNSGITYCNYPIQKDIWTLVWAGDSGDFKLFEEVLEENE